MTVVVNLSDKILNSDHYSLLNKGLSYVPVTKPDPFHMEVEMYKTQRILYSHEIRRDIVKTSPHPFYKRHQKDIRTPNASIKTFIQT
ncbi:Hypothetical predicted protein, partial [Pelobates cultripes]